VPDEARLLAQDPLHIFFRKSEGFVNSVEARVWNTFNLNGAAPRSIHATHENLH